jgi:sulfur carrier protein
MKKKIKIKINGKLNIIDNKTKVSVLLKDLKVPLRKVAIELNREIVNKKKLNKIFLKTNDKLEIVHFIGGG